MFKYAIVKKPGKSLINGITSASLGKPDYEKALQQHDFYVETLKKCGVEVTILEADEEYPDSTFVEDPAIVTQKCAIITNPGASSRNGEKTKMAEVLKKIHDNIEYIKDPGTVEGGDVMRVGDHFYIGLSARTNQEGAQQLIEVLNKYGYTGSIVSLEKVLHLKTGLAYLENNTLLVSGEFVDKVEFEDFNKIIIDENESYAANCIWVNDHVLVPAGHEKTRKDIEAAGYKVEVVDTSEFRKLDGGLSCLSLRF